MALVPLKVNVPERIRQKCKIRAAQYGISMSEFVERLIESAPEPERIVNGDDNAAA